MGRQMMELHQVAQEILDKYGEMPREDFRKLYASSLSAAAVELIEEALVSSGRAKVEQGSWKLIERRKKRVQAEKKG